MNQINNIIVIGGNAAGPAAAAKAKRTNPNANVILFEAGSFISTGTCELPFLISNEIKNYEDIVFYTAEKFKVEKGVEVFTQHLVESINKKEKYINVENLLTNSSKTFLFDKLIITTGSKANRLTQLPEGLENVFNLKSVTDYLNIKEYTKSNKLSNVLIIGAGYIGLEVADAYSKLGIDVTIVDKESNPLAGFDFDIRKRVLNSFPKNMKSYLGYTPKFNIGKNRVMSVNIDGRINKFGLILVAVGVSPSNYLAKKTGLKIGQFGGLVVDGKMKTSDPNIFAAGDNIEIKNKLTRKFGYYPFAKYAHDSGHIAGCNAAGGNLHAEDIIPNFALSVFGNSIASVGMSEFEAKEISYNNIAISAVGRNLVEVMPNSREVFGKVIIDKYNKLFLGASFFGGSEVAGYADLIATMIYNKSDVRSLAKINFNYTPPLTPFVNLLSILGRKI